MICRDCKGKGGSVVWTGGRRRWVKCPYCNPTRTPKILRDLLRDGSKNQTRLF